ncbi:hypothetical protein QUF50_03220 [Thiotrichales bacterium HSG1]|nr:hypothetical protein [Thiotrichales bacterium HSG1]
MISNPNRINSHIHGPKHWSRVERNGLYICQLNDADEDVIRLFAIFHDSMRLNDGRDAEHGVRGAEYAKSLLNKEYELSEEKFELLYYACQYHNKRVVETVKDKTIGTCWDADRLDLRRVGIKPSEKMLYSREAKFIVRENKWGELTKFGNRIVNNESIMEFWKKLIG